MRLIDVRAPTVKTYPFAERQSRDDESSVIEKYLCSPETDEDYANMEEASTYHYNLKYCLFTKRFKKDEEIICKKEVKPLFLDMYDEERNIIHCGFTDHHIMHSISYYVCIFHYSYTYNHILIAISTMSTYIIILLQNCGDLDMLQLFRDKSFRTVGDILLE